MSPQLPLRAFSILEQKKETPPLYGHGSPIHTDSKTRDKFLQGTSLISCENESMNWLQKTSFTFNVPVDSDSGFAAEKKKWEIMGLVRGHLEGTERFSTKPVFYHAINDVISVEMSEFSAIIDEMIARGFLEKLDIRGEEAFRWAGNAPSFPGKLPL